MCELKGTKSSMTDMPQTVCLRKCKKFDGRCVLMCQGIKIAASISHEVHLDRQTHGK